MTKKALAILIGSISAGVLVAGGVTTGIVVGTNLKNNKVTTRTAFVEEYAGDSQAYYNDSLIEIYQGMGLKSGNSMTTGDSSDIYLRVDNDKSVKLEENSKMVVTKLSNKELALNLLYGDFHFNVENKLNADETMEFTAGQTIMSVRGTQGHGSYHPELDRLEFYVYAGEVKLEVEGKTESVVAGKKLIVEDNVITTEAYNIEDIDDSCKLEIVKKDENIERVADAFIEQGATVSKEEIIEDIKHIHTMTITEHTAKSHTAKCSTCDYEATVDHSKSNDVTIVMTKAATEDEDGYYTVTCKDCKESWTVAIPMLGHKEPDTTESEDDHNVHNFVLESTDEAKYSCQSGVAHYACSCGETKDEEIYPTTDHNYGDFETVAEPTYMSNGSEKAICSICGEEITHILEKYTYGGCKITASGAKLSLKDEEEQYSYMILDYDTEVEVKYENSDYTFDYYIIDDTTIVKEPNFTFMVSKDTNIVVHYKDVESNYVEEIVSEPTCTDYGLKSMTDTVTGAVFYVQYGNPNGHYYNEKVTLRETTCNVEGYYYQQCKYCEEKQYGFEKPNGHDYQYSRILTEASGSTVGTKEYVCTMCDATEERNYIAATYPSLTNMAYLVETYDNASGVSGSLMRDEEYVNYGNTTIYYTFRDSSSTLSSYKEANLKTYIAFVDNGVHSPIYIMTETQSGTLYHEYSGNSTYSNWAIYGYADSQEDFIKFLAEHDFGPSSYRSNMFDIFDGWAERYNSLAGDFSNYEIEYGDWHEDDYLGIEVREIIVDMGTKYYYLVDRNNCNYKLERSRSGELIVGMQKATSASLGASNWIKTNEDSTTEKLYRGISSNGQTYPYDTNNTTISASDFENIGYAKINLTDCSSSYMSSYEVNKHYGVMNYYNTFKLTPKTLNLMEFDHYEIINADGDWITLLDDFTSMTYYQISMDIFDELRPLDIKAVYNETPTVMVHVEDACFQGINGWVYDSGAVVVGDEITFEPENYDLFDHWEVYINGEKESDAIVTECLDGDNLVYSFNEGEEILVKCILKEDSGSTDGVQLVINSTHASMVFMNDDGEILDISSGILAKNYSYYFKVDSVDIGYGYSNIEFKLYDAEGQEIEDVESYVEERYGDKYFVGFWDNTVVKFEITVETYAVNYDNFVTVSAPEGYFIGVTEKGSYGLNYRMIASSVAVGYETTVVLIHYEDADLVVSNYVLATIANGSYALDCSDYETTGGISVNMAMVLSEITEEEFNNDYVTVSINAMNLHFTEDKTDYLSGSVGIKKGTTLYVSYPQGLGYSCFSLQGSDDKETMTTIRSQSTSTSYTFTDDYKYYYIIGQMSF